ncbi:MAG: HIT family protein [Candidatus Korarchaeota archaeon]|nr:HIT family protein [Candidatus Korarchaeota archaeon]NIU84578.1 HIT domain-containing protein [Candidatus Thorarchaeota archaeon]NIW14636.1 HIT domain-containing protein [Candidatus Thorarchaeota archaeon]
MNNEDCVFCQIATGKLEARKIYDDGEVIGLVDVNPRFAKGQCVVFPREHKSQFHHLSDETLTSLILATKKIARKIKETFNPEFVSIFSRGQTIDHIHFLLFPAGTGEVIDKFIELIFAQEKLNEESTEKKLDAIQEKLKVD